MPLSCLNINGNEVDQSRLYVCKLKTLVHSDQKQKKVKIKNQNILYFPHFLLENFR